ncbi:Acetyltransferase (GNAT) domain protein [anaerobic digester metagenome]
MKVITEGKKWNKTLEENFSNIDVYSKYEYYNLYEKHYDVKSESIFWEDEYLKVFWPHLIRDVSKLKRCADFSCYDLTTPYGYGGPVIHMNTSDKVKASESTRSFFEDYKEYALNNGYVSEFIRFDPFLRNWEFFEGIFHVEHVNDVVLVDLSQELDKIWNDIRRGHRRHIQNSIKEGCKVRFIENPSEEDLSDFIKLYCSTMDRNHADQKYYFSTEFIEDHFKLLNTLLTVVEHGNNTIGMTMFIYGNDSIHYHLTGTSTDTEKVYPPHLTLFETIKWAKERKFRYLSLGGGREINDNLFEFKRRFSRLTRQNHIGKLIFDEDVYSELMKLNEPIPETTNYFPKYRYGYEKIV